MKIYTLISKMILPVSMETCWNYFSDPKNLQEITPPDMHFKIISEPSGKMYPGQIIPYRIKIFPMISVSWVTEITHVKDYEYFVDEQRFGPYKFWHHRHSFKETGSGIEMTDLVHYAIPFGIIGRLAHKLIIKKKLKNIFDFRTAKLKAEFHQ
ncbi:MAG: SRPBCC family protein [Syntrophothermus sp.]